MDELRTYWKRLFEEESEKDSDIVNLAIEYCSYFSLYVSKVTNISDVEKLVDFTQMMMELFSIEELNHFIDEVNEHYSWKRSLTNSICYKQPNNVELLEAKSLVLYQIRNKEKM